MALTGSLWKRYAPEGRQWDPPKHRYSGGMERTTSLAVQAALLDRAVDLYWRNRPDPRRPAETVTPAL